MGYIELPMADPTSQRQRPGSLLRRIIIPAVLVLLCLQFYVLPQYLYSTPDAVLKLSSYHADQLRAGLGRCELARSPQVEYALPVSATRKNPRYNPSYGQQKTIVLLNATLFDGEKVLQNAVDIVLSKGVIASVAPVNSKSYDVAAEDTFNVHGRYITPGLVDMHSHHLVESWPSLAATGDGNEVNPAFGPITSFVRSLDSMTSYDIATTIIASGGVTTSLILPGSANIMGGEAFIVKNMLRSGNASEEVVEELLLEHGVPHHERRRYMKMACGENPRGVYDHTRMGNAWILRKHMTRAKQLMEKQDAWCLSAAAALAEGDRKAIKVLVSEEKDQMVDALELDSTIAMLRGKVNVNVHCYEPEDFEDMLMHSHEFGFRVRAFHHALSAWKVPEMLKEKGENITIATFADFGLYKKEGYESNLWAGKILADHDVPVAYKSDHSEGELNAKYLMFHAAIAHSFHLSEEKALQSVTSIPAKSLDIDHRVGYVRAGYDADLVIWNSHPLSVGATPLQVLIDGRATLDPNKVKDSLGKTDIPDVPGIEQSQMRFVPEAETRGLVCQDVKTRRKQTVITGIKRSFLDFNSVQETNTEYTMVVEDGKVSCFGPSTECISTAAEKTEIKLKNGHALPGLTAISAALGLADIDTAEETTDGTVSNEVDVTKPESVDYAKYGVHLDGRAFKRARYGGITKAITHPRGSGFLVGVSTGIKTGGASDILDGGIFQDDVALHIHIGQDDKATKSTPTVSGAIATLRKILNEAPGHENVYGKAANGTLPIIAHVENEYDIVQLIKIKLQYPDINLILYGSAGMPLVAEKIAAAKIPVILAPVRAAPDQWEKKDALTGPPLTKSSAEILTDAGVFWGLAVGSMGDSKIQNLIVEASWAGKYAGLSKLETVNLVSRNIEQILKLDVGGAKGDVVIWEGNPLEFGASVVLSIDGAGGAVVDCWPEVQ